MIIALFKCMQLPRQWKCWQFEYIYKKTELQKEFGLITRSPFIHKNVWIVYTDFYRHRNVQKTRKVFKKQYFSTHSRISALILSLCCEQTWEIHFFLDTKKEKAGKESGHHPHTRSRASNMIILFPLITWRETQTKEHSSPHRINHIT